MRVALFAGCGLFLLCMAQAVASDLPQGAVMERVVLVARHGIRSPTQSIADLDRQTGRHWPAWPVAPGQLTDHGRQTLAVMAKALAVRYAAVLPQGHCPSAPVLALRADPMDDRTRQSGAIMAQVMAGGCAIADVSGAMGQPDPLFKGLSAEASPFNQASVAADIDRLITRPLPVDVAQGIARLQAVTGQPTLGGALHQSWKHGVPHLEGGPQTAATLAENLLLAHVEGLDPDWAGPDVAGLISHTMRVHEYVSAQIRREPVMALRRNGALAKTIETLMEGQAAKLPDGATIDASTRMIVFAGHDTTLDGLATIFGLDWGFDDQPDRTAPDTILAFERYRLSPSMHMVRIVVVHQSLEALRTGAEPEPAREVRRIFCLQSTSSKPECQFR